MAQATETRRQRQRRELTAEVVVEARRQLQAGGPAGVSWRGIARAVGVNPASLYTYFDNLDEVFTAVILDSFGRLGQAIQESSARIADDTPLERLIELARVYRQWAVAHPAEFNLIFTDQIPGYAAPPDGPTVAVQSDIFVPFGLALAELAGVDISDDGPGATPERPENPAAFVGLWATMHGLVMLEINNHLPFVDDHEPVFIDAMQQALSGWQT